MTGAGSSPTPEPAPPGEATGLRRLLRPMSLVRIAFVVGAAALGIYAVARDLDGFVEAAGRVGAVRSAVALVLVIAGLWVSAEVWRMAVIAVAGPLPSRAARSVYFVSQLGKYLPGGIWSIAAQIDLARRHGLRRASMGAAAMLFVAFHVATGLLVAAVLLPVGAPSVVTGRWWLVALAAAAGIVGLVPVLLRRGLDLLLRVARRDHPPIALTLGQVLVPSAWMLVVWAFYGAATAVVAGPLAPTSGVGELLAASTGGFALAWIVGILVIPAPAGVGAREVALVGVLAPLTGVTAATSLAILLRVVHTLGDLLLAAWSAWSQRMANRAA